MKNQNKINFNLINELYMAWVNERDPFMQRKRKEDIRRSVSSYELLMYSTRYSLPFKAFRDIFSLSDLFKTLDEMKKQGEDITYLTSQALVIENLEDIQDLNELVKKNVPSEIGNFELKFQGNNVFKYGDVKGIGKKFPYTCANYFDLALVEQMINNSKDYKGIPVIITLDNIGQLPLEKLSEIEKKFDVAGVRIIEKDRAISRHQGEQRPLNLRTYKQIRAIVDDEIISQLYVSENVDKMHVDYQLATQIICKLVDKIEYDFETKNKNALPFSDEMSNASGLVGLLTGKSICTGYSEILRNVLSCVGIDSTVIIGRDTNNKEHAWNQIKLGNTWFNTDLTFARKQIRKGEHSGDLFMSDMAFFGDRREWTFERGQEVNGKSVETTVAIGGHKEAYGQNHKQCKGYITPYLTSTLMERFRQYDKDRKDGKSKNYKDVTLYVGSNTEKTRSESRTTSNPQR